ncbi:Alpha/Beta hydrolase protein [Trametes polyzona]|nr:Alpha/Beta hydrolase protein [Trametes polyzona]
MQRGGCEPQLHLLCDPSSSRAYRIPRSTSMAHPVLDPELAAAVGPYTNEEPARLPTVEEARAYFENYVTAPFKEYMKASLPPASTYSVQDRTIPVEGGEIVVRCLVPVVGDEQETFPVLVNLHGGGWTVGSIELDDYPLRKLCVELKLSVVNVEYRLAPEYPFPTAVMDGLAALRWVVTNAALLRADLKKGFLVGGHSAGANLAAVLAHETLLDPFFRDTPGRRLTGQLIREPVIVHPDAVPAELKPQMTSLAENRYVPPLGGAMVEHLIRIYAPVPTDPRFSPLLYAPEVRAKAPPAFIQGMGCDPLRDDARAYTRALGEAGVRHRYIEYPGFSHGFHYNYPGLSAGAKVRADVVQGIQWLLGRESVLDGLV